jgi:uncharacterized membrane protein
MLSLDFWTKSSMNYLFWKLLLSFCIVIVGIIGIPTMCFMRLNVEQVMIGWGVIGSLLAFLLILFIIISIMGCIDDKVKIDPNSIKSRTQTQLIMYQV